MKALRTVLLYNFDDAEKKVALHIDRFGQVNIVCNCFIEGHPSEKKQKKITSYKITKISLKP